MSEQKTIKHKMDLEIPNYIKGKKIVMNAELYLEELVTVMMAFLEVIENSDDFAKLNNNQKEMVIFEYGVGYLKQLYSNNIENKGPAQ